MFYNTEKQTKAESSLQNLKQRKTVGQYTHQFILYAHKTGWEPRTLVGLYTQGLKKEVRVALVLSRAQFITLAAVLNMALKIANELNGVKSNNVPPTSATNSDAMDISAMRGQLLESERSQMMWEGLCFWCGKQGHQSRECPDKGKGKGVARVAEMEELDQWRSGAKSFGEEGAAEGSKKAELGTDGYAPPELKQGVVTYHDHHSSSNQIPGGFGSYT
ncbi:hypothetical protein PTTG_26115 [Puccinia triticina 1-1 BBBD Race 1]|uniref:CCHC-type domain-containing protein n=1 Tax=Puccinia triticina (isolate 1-1 / race 1 (BBBD)) TaxID=630390 RepID=A0A180GZ52_PUCT1|nr:hypothetical protein PTTG_26115 [Puccinia triticina 1-1 BBBD Race 1]